MPLEDESLDLTPENIFVPKQSPVCKKAEKPEGGDEPGFPKLIMGSENDESQVWFKQDDSFNQPLVMCNLKIYSTDNDHPFNRESKIFIALWSQMLNEHTRELKYTA